jgi:excisionase family DNA binding protein
VVSSGKWLTTGEAAAGLAVSDETVRRWCTAGEVFRAGETMRTAGKGGRGGHWRILAAAVQRVAREQLGPQ